MGLNLISSCLDSNITAWTKYQVWNDFKQSNYFIFTRIPVINDPILTFNNQKARLGVSRVQQKLNLNNTYFVFFLI